MDSSRDTDNGTPFNSPVSTNKPSKPDISPSRETERSVFQNCPFSLQFEDNVNFSIPFLNTFKIVKLFYFYQLVCLEILESF